MKKFVLFSLVIMVAVAAGFGLQRYLIHQENQNLGPELPPQANVIGEPRPEFAMKDLDGKLRNIKEWDGQVVLVNFWATWCPPCKKEIPAFMVLQEQYRDRGFQVIGIAIDDEQAVRDYADTLGINYPVMAAELEALELARMYGNRVNALPFSAFIDRDGRIALTRPGELSEQETEDIILKLL